MHEHIVGGYLYDRYLNRMQDAFNDTPDNCLMGDKSSQTDENPNYILAIRISVDITRIGVCISIGIVAFSPMNNMHGR